LISRLAPDSWGRRRTKRAERTSRGARAEPKHAGSAADGNRGAGRCLLERQIRLSLHSPPTRRRLRRSEDASRQFRYYRRRHCPTASSYHLRAASVSSRRASSIDYSPGASRGNEWAGYERSNRTAKRSQTAGSSEVGRHHGARSHSGSLGRRPKRYSHLLSSGSAVWLYLGVDPAADVSVDVRHSDDQRPDRTRDRAGLAGLFSSHLRLGYGGRD